MKRIHILKLISLLIAISISWIVGWFFYFGFAIIVRPQFGNNREETIQMKNDYCLEKGFENLVITFFVALMLAVIIHLILKDKKFSSIVFFVAFVICCVGNYFGLNNYYYGMISEIDYVFPK